MPTTTAVDPQAALQKVLAKIEKDLGKGMIHRASELDPVYHLPFANPHLNYATEGGAPWDRFMALYGDESTGKSHAALELIAQGQGLPETAERILVPRISYHHGLGHDDVVKRLQGEREWINDSFPDGAEGVYYNIEGEFDKIRAQRLGIDTDRLYLVESNIIEDIVGVMESLYQFFHIHVLDSTSNGTSLLSLKQDTGKSLVGTDARQWKVTIRDSMVHFGTKNSGIPNLGVLIHQMSTNVRTGGAQAMSTRYLRHTSSCSVRFNRGAFLWRKDGALVEDKPTGADDVSMAGTAEPDGVAVYAKIEKSRTCRPFRVAAMQFDYKTLGYVPVHELTISGIYHGVIEKNGSWFKVAGEEKGVQGLPKIYARVAEDRELQDQILSRLMDYTQDT